MTVGAVVPVRGPAPFLAEALDSVLAEEPAEVVVVDDGSDPPVTLADRHASVRVVRREASGGPAAARNAGVAALGSGVELVAFCDADDAWTPGSLAPRVRALGDEPRAALAFGAPRIVDAAGRETGERWSVPPGGPLPGPEALYAVNPILTSSVVLRRAAFGRGFDESYVHAEDWELWLRLLGDGHLLVCVPEAQVRYRRHAGGLTADVLALARAQRRVHEAYADLAGPVARAAAERADREGEAEGLLRAGRPDAARHLLDPGLRRALLAVPGLRRLLGRRPPYGG